MPTYETECHLSEERRVANHVKDLYLQYEGTTIGIAKSRKFDPFDFTFINATSAALIGLFEIKVRDIAFGAYGSYMLDELKFTKLVRLAEQGHPVFLVVEFKDKLVWMEIHAGSTVVGRGTSARWDRPGERVPVVLLSYDEFTPIYN